MKSLIVVAVILTIIIALKYFSSKKPNQKSETTVYKYLRKDYLMTRAENDFFKLLTEAVGSTYNIFPQIHLSAILNQRVKSQNWKAAFRHINGKSVDFVICDKQYNKPLIAIELDDLSHNEENRRLRDEEEERIFADANLSLIRFKNVNELSSEDIYKRIAEQLANQ